MTINPEYIKTDPGHILFTGLISYLYIVIHFYLPSIRVEPGTMKASRKLLHICELSVGSGGSILEGPQLRMRADIAFL